MLNRFALFLKKHSTLIGFVQWTMVGFYFSLLFSPFLGIFFPLQKESLETFSLFIFWKIGWPFIVILTLFLGRFWCGFLCPEGTLTEFFSHNGQKRSIPRWIRWPIWPYVTTILYFSSVALGDIAREFQLLFALFSFLTLLAILIGFLYGQGHRVWCMYLCPTNTLWKIISKLSFISFQVDAQKWNAYQGQKEKVHCAPLINIKQMKSPSNCHMCARCTDYQGAVSLKYHESKREFLLPASKEDAILLLILHALSCLLLYSSFYKRATLLESSYLEFLGFLGLLLILVHLLVALFLFVVSRTVKKISWSQLILGLSPFCALGFLLAAILPLNTYIRSIEWAKTLYLIPYGLVFLAWLSSIRLGWKMIFQEKSLANTFAIFFYTLAASFLTISWFIALLWIV